MTPLRLLWLEYAMRSLNPLAPSWLFSKFLFKQAKLRGGVMSTVKIRIAGFEFAIRRYI